MITDVTIISTNLNKNILDDFKDYKIIDGNFYYEELLQMKKVIFFNVLSNLDEKKIKELFKFLNKNNVMFINATNNIEEVLYTKNLIVNDEDKKVLEGTTIEVLKNEKTLRRLGFNLPFIIQLSILLKDYELTDKIFMNKESLVKELWK